MATNDIAFYGSILGPMLGMLAISLGLLIRDIRHARRAI